MNPVTFPARRFVGFLLLAGVVAVAAAPQAARAGNDTAGFSWFGAGRVAGSGKLTSETRAVGAFQAIALRTSMKLVLRQGTREGIELRGDDNLLSMIETTVVDRGGLPTLEIAARPGSRFSTSNQMVATIDVVTLRALSISGSGDVTVDALNTPGLAVAISGSGKVRIGQLTADEVSAKVSGSGEIAFGGRTARLGVSISGSGDVDTRSLEADDVTLSVAGSGNARVTARKTLVVSIAGVGNVRYTGDPTVKSSIAGAGKVSKE